MIPPAWIQKTHHWIRTFLAFPSEFQYAYCTWSSATPLFEWSNISLPFITYWILCSYITVFLCRMASTLVRSLFIGRRENTTSVIVVDGKEPQETIESTWQHGSFTRYVIFPTGRFIYGRYNNICSGVSSGFEQFIAKIIYMSLLLLFIIGFIRICTNYNNEIVGYYPESVRIYDSISTWTEGGNILSFWSALKFL